MPSFDDFELVEEEEEEEQPRMVPGSRVRDAHGRSWCRVAGPAGVYWWMIGTTTAQYTSPEEITARPGRYSDNFQLLRVLRASGPVPRQNGGHFCLARCSVRQWIHILRQRGRLLELFLVFYVNG